MTESAQQAAVTLASQEVKAYASLLAVDADDQGYIVRELAAAASGAYTLSEIKADLRLGIIA